LARKPGALAGFTLFRQCEYFDAVI
jgi:hypothetical protein